MKDCLLQATEEVCGRTKGLTRHTATWWWNQDVAKLVAKKRRFKIWSQTKSETDRAAFCNARKIASKEIHKAQETERKKFGAKLSDEDMKGSIDQVMKIFERVIERKMRNLVSLDDVQFEFRPGRGTTDAIYSARQIQEKYLAQKKDLCIAFVDLEKACDRVPRDVLWWVLRQSGVDEGLCE